MKIRELMRQLESLDPEWNVWVISENSRALFHGTGFHHLDFIHTSCLRADFDGVVLFTKPYTETPESTKLLSDRILAEKEPTDLPIAITKTGDQNYGTRHLTRMLAWRLFSLHALA